MFWNLLKFKGGANMSKTLQHSMKSLFTQDKQGKPRQVIGELQNCINNLLNYRQINP